MYVVGDGGGDDDDYCNNNNSNNSNEKRTCVLIDFAISADSNVIKKEAEKNVKI